MAPLDWGLGHTTRCVPLINYIRALGHRVVMAGNAPQRSFISQTFSDIDTIDLQGYNVTYSKWNKLAQIGVLSQLPHLHSTIIKEHKWLQQVVDEHSIDGIISDNRYGLFHHNTPSVIITHQLCVQTGMGSLADRTVQQLHYKYLNRFSTTWVADTQATPGLGGKLSHSTTLPKNYAYLGLLSQFSAAEAAPQTDGSLLILISGPEPQRTALSRILWQQMLMYNGKVVFVEGSEDAPPPTTILPHITYHKRLTNAALLPLLQSADMVVCRSGYSTLMDLVALQKRAILIPTPDRPSRNILPHSCIKKVYFIQQSKVVLTCSMRSQLQVNSPFKPRLCSMLMMHTNPCWQRGSVNYRSYIFA